MLDAARQSHLGRQEAGAAVLAPVCGCFFCYAFPLLARIPCDGAGFGWTRHAKRTAGAVSVAATGRQPVPSVWPARAVRK
jgi:hypothetical protein